MRINYRTLGPLFATAFAAAAITAAPVASAEPACVNADGSLCGVTNAGPDGASAAVPGGPSAEADRGGASAAVPGGPVVDTNPGGASVEAVPGGPNAEATRDGAAAAVPGGPSVEADRDGASFAIPGGPNAAADPGGVTGCLWPGGPCV
jgi:hypothetical protein